MMIGKRKHKRNNKRIKYVNNVQYIKINLHINKMEENKLL
jgi:hypothetical protein